MTGIVAADHIVAVMGVACDNRELGHIKSRLVGFHDAYLGFVVGFVDRQDSVVVVHRLRLPEVLRRFCRSGTLSWWLAVASGVCPPR